MNNAAGERSEPAATPTIRFKDRLLFLANALKQHHVGLEERDDGVWSLYLGPVLIGTIDERTMKVYE